MTVAGTKRSPKRLNFHTGIGDAIVTRAATEFPILALVPTYRRAEIARQLASLNANLLFVRHSAEASAAICENDVLKPKHVRAHQFVHVDFLQKPVNKPSS